MHEVYLDNHSATRIDERVLVEMTPYLKEYYGNAQSIHTAGARAKDALDKARKEVAGLIGAQEPEIYFTSCGSEANNLALKGIAVAYQEKGKHIIVSGIEHFSVLYAARRLEQAGFDITHLPVDKYGLVSADDLKKAIKPQTILISIQHANPEIGTIQPINEMARIAHDKGVLFHTDAVSTAGVIPVNVKELGVDLLSLSSSQIHGPKGAAALYVKKGVRVIPLIDGGIQESGRRAGTEDIPAITGFGSACRIAKNASVENSKRMRQLRDRLITELPRNIDYLYLNGHPEKRLPNNVNFSVEFVEGEGMMLLLDEKGIYVTSGSACTSKSLKMSHVLSAIKIDAAIAQGSLVMTLSKYNNDTDIDYVLAEIPPIVKKLRNMSPLYAFFLKTGTRHVAGPGTDYEHEHGQND
ncbi:MAG TPA: cysteine desulfurase family protein [bacterium]